MQVSSPSTATNHFGQASLNQAGPGWQRTVIPANEEAEVGGLQGQDKHG